MPDDYTVLVESAITYIMDGLRCVTPPCDCGRPDCIPNQEKALKRCAQSVLTQYINSIQIVFDVAEGKE